MTTHTPEQVAAIIAQFKKDDEQRATLAAIDAEIAQEEAAQATDVPEWLQGPAETVTVEYLNDMLDYITPDTLHWEELGRVIKVSCSDSAEEAFQAWHHWIEESVDNYPGDIRKCRRLWDGFAPERGGPDLNMMRELAKQSGWGKVKPEPKPKLDVEALFADVELKHAEHLAHLSEVERKHRMKTEVLPDVINETTIAPPRLDMAIIPKALRTYATDVARNVGCDPTVCVMAGLTAVATALDSQSRIVPREGYKVQPVMWSMSIGWPSEKKSPGSKPMFAPISVLEAADYQRYQQALLNWEGQEAAYAASKKAFLTHASKPDHLGPDGTITDAPVVHDLPRKPVPLRMVVNDITSQKLVRLMADRPHGMTVYLDEGTSWLSKLANPRSGEDRGCWVDSYEGDRYSLDRVGTNGVGGETVTVENFCVSLYMNLQPEELKKHTATLTTDGLILRFIPAILNPELTTVGDTTVRPDGEAWLEVLRTIHAMGKRMFKLSPGATALYNEFEAYIVDYNKSLHQAGYSKYVVGAHGKMFGTCARIAALFHTLEIGSGTTRSDAEVSQETMRCAIAFMKDYLSPSVVCIDEIVMGENNIARAAAEYVLQSKEDVLSMRDLKRGMKRQFPPDMSDSVKELRLRDAMGMLEQRRWVLPGNDTGRSVSWAVHPGLREQYTEKRNHIILTRLEMIEKIRRVGRDRKTGKT